MTRAFMAVGDDMLIATITGLNLYKCACELAKTTAGIR
jgi:hypothetical protein